jgi:Sel1 repeat
MKPQLAPKVSMRSVSSASVVVIAVAVLCIPRLSGQTGSTSAVASNSTRMVVCEAADDACAQPNAQYNFVWSFDGMAGTIVSPANGNGAELTIETMDQDRIVIRRVDRSGATAGRSATYTGNIRGSRISGTIQWEWPDHPGPPTSGTWSAVLQDQPPAAQATGATAPGTSQAGLPPRLLECEANGPCNSAWIIEGAAGEATWFLRSPVRAKLTIIRSDPDDILIRRTDLTDGNSAVYSGTRHGDSYSGAVVWSSPGHPGDSSGHWSATVPQTSCDASASLSSEDALRVGRNALMFNLRRAAFDCYIAAAKTGDATAQTAVGLIYYQGNNTEVPQNYEQALFWLQKAASQDVYAAEKTLADMYMLGQGTKRDPQLSHFYADKAAEQKRDMEREQDRQERAEARREEHAERAADRGAQVLTGFVMAATFGAFLF